MIIMIISSKLKIQKWKKNQENINQQFSMPKIKFVKNRQLKLNISINLYKIFHENMKILQNKNIC